MHHYFTRLTDSLEKPETRKYSVRVERRVLRNSPEESNFTSQAVNNLLGIGMLGLHEQVCKRVGFGNSFSGLRHRNFKSLDIGDLYQFGVAGGGTLVQLLRIHNTTAWGFDTFTGLPPEQKGELSIKDWKPGAFRGNGVLNASGVHELVARKVRAATGSSLLPGQLSLLTGTFNETLRPGLARERGMRPAVYVDIDSDLFISAWEALDWLFTERLLLPGSVIGYDDWWTIACASNNTDVEAHGEPRAHLLAARKYQASFRCICGPCEPITPGVAFGGRTYFVLEALGGSTVSSSGFTMTREDAAYWMARARSCGIAKKKRAVLV